MKITFDYQADIEVSVEADMTAARAGCASGRCAGGHGDPDDCFPPEPAQAEILKVTAGGVEMPKFMWKEWGVDEDKLERVALEDTE